MREDEHPQTIAVVQTRGKSLGVRVDVSDAGRLTLGEDVCGVLLAYPGTDGRIVDWRATIAAVPVRARTPAERPCQGCRRPAGRSQGD